MDSLEIKALMYGYEKLIAHLTRLLNECENHETQHKDYLKLRLNSLFDKWSSLQMTLKQKD